MMIKLKNVTKKYGKHLVLDSIDLEFANTVGVYGVLGRNGVGKTTLMKMIFNIFRKKSPASKRSESGR